MTGTKKDGAAYPAPSSFFLHQISHLAEFPEVVCFARMRDRGKTIVLITHDPEVAAWADRTVHIRDGKLLTDEQERAFTARYERKGATT